MNEDKRRIWLYWVLIAISCIALLTMVASCRTVYVDRPVVHHEIEYRDRVDSISVHDSIFIKEVQKGDSTTRIEYRYRDRFRYIYQTDTVSVHDTISVVNERVVEKTVARMNGFQKFFFWLGIASILLLVVYIIVKVKF